MSCRPRDANAEEQISHHIAAAASRTEPMELVPPAFLPPFPRISVETRQEKILRREKKQYMAVKLDKEEIQLYHRFGEGVKLRTKAAASLVNDAKAIEPMMQELDAKWGTGKKKSKTLNRPSRLRKGITGHNEVREQELMVIFKIIKLFEKKPMYYMRELDEQFQDQAVWPLRDLVPAVAYYYVNGPWRSRWVRFGYRPEDDPASRFDQLLEFRLSAAQLRQWSTALMKAEKVLAVTGDAGKAEKEGGARAKARDAGQDGCSAGDGEASGDGNGDGGVNEERAFPRGGVLPDVRLTKRTKGRFASQVVLNGVNLSARNRHIIGESPIRAVQELALTSPRLDEPNTSTGWWPAELMEKLRKVTLQGIHSCVKAKQADALAVATAAKAAGAAAVEAGASESSADGPRDAKKREAGGEEEGDATAGDEAVEQESKKNTTRAAAEGGTGAVSGGAADSEPNSLGLLERASSMSRPAHERPSLTREEFMLRVKADASSVEVISAQAAGTGADGYGDGVQGGAAGSAPGGGVSGTRPGGGSSTTRAKGVGGSTRGTPRRDPWGRGGKGSSSRPATKQKEKKRRRDRGDREATFVAAGREMIGSSDMDTESDFVNSSDMVDDSDEDDFAGAESESDSDQVSNAESEIESDADSAEAENDPETGAKGGDMSGKAVK